MTDKEQLESVYAGMAMMGFIIQGQDLDVIPELSKKMAHKMMEEESTVGLPAIKRRTKK
jgi:hypothetical protein